MTSKWIFLIKEITKRMWFRATLYCVFAISVALIGFALDNVFPKELTEFLAPNVVSDILNILAASMLAVTVFSLAGMVSAYANASSSTTPRVTKLLMADANSQRALSTFLGSFLFSVVGIVAIGVGLESSGRFTLFLAALSVIFIITLTLLRWIDQISRLGRVGETIDLVEKTTLEALIKRAKKPCLGGKRYLKAPESIRSIRCQNTGYVQYIDMGSLQDLALKFGCEIYVEVLPGAFVSPSAYLASVTIQPTKELVEGIRKSVLVDDSRTFSQDPRFGFIVLAEIAQKALSPAVNDPGTAIDIIGTALRLCFSWAQEKTSSGNFESEYDRVFVKELNEADFFDDVFNPIARDGASSPEVSIRLQKAYLALKLSNYKPFSAGAETHAKNLLLRTKDAMASDYDKKRVEAIYLEVRSQQKNVSKLRPMNH